VGVHSSRAGFYAQWRGTRRDLERALAALRMLSGALCVTAPGAEALCDGVLAALGRLFDADWAALVLVDDELASATASPFTWRHQDRKAGPPDDVAVLAARLIARWTAGDEPPGKGADQPPGARSDHGVLGAPMWLDHRPVGALLIGRAGISGHDATGVSILETAANQIIVALRNAWLFEHSEQIRRQAVDGWAEAERRAQELARRNEQLRRARGRLARAQQAELVNTERHRIARDLHDGVAQGLVGIGMHLEWCHRHPGTAPGVHERLLTSKELARSALGQIRTAVFELSQLEQAGTGLEQALRDLATDFRSAGPLRVSVRVCGPQRPLPPEVEHSLFQISQESLWNVVRHARADRAWLELRYRPGQVRLSISDNGHGDLAVLRRHLSRPARGAHGLRNIGERATELGGDAALERRPGGGVRLRVHVPAPDEVPAADGPDADGPAAGARPGGGAGR
jgi:signal transduction histidine kinase